MYALAWGVVYQAIQDALHAKRIQQVGGAVREDLKDAESFITDTEWSSGSAMIINKLWNMCENKWSVNYAEAK
jgi:hypothetical protein